MIDKSLVALVRRCARHLDKLEADWAVGGATAMGAHGYVRQTRDVDLFIADDCRADLLAALKGDGYLVDDVMPPVHYVVTPLKAADPESRVDLLFPALGIETLGLMAARRVSIAGMKLPVMPLAHLVALKLQTDPLFDRDRYDKDLQDLRELRARGYIDSRKVEELLEDVRDKAAVRRLHDLLTPDHG